MAEHQTPRFVSHETSNAKVRVSRNIKRQGSCLTNLARKKPEICVFSPLTLDEQELGLTNERRFAEAQAKIIHGNWRNFFLDRHD
jgi:hypothetical protein